MRGRGSGLGGRRCGRAFRALDRGGATGLLEAIRAAWGAKDVGEVVGIANARPGPDFAGLVPVVVYCAEQGDETASRVLVHAGAQLAEQVRLVWQRMQAGGVTQAGVAYTGSVVEKIAQVRQVMVRRIEASCAGSAGGGGCGERVGWGDVAGSGFASFRMRRAFLRGGDRQLKGDGSLSPESDLKFRI